MKLSLLEQETVLLYNVPLYFDSIVFRRFSGSDGLLYRFKDIHGPVLPSPRFSDGRLIPGSFGPFTGGFAPLFAVRLPNRHTAFGDNEVVGVLFDDLLRVLIGKAV